MGAKVEIKHSEKAKTESFQGVQFVESDHVKEIPVVPDISLSLLETDACKVYLSRSRDEEQVV